MVGGAGSLVINPPANQTHPRLVFFSHSLKGLRIECNDCIEHVLRAGKRKAPPPAGSGPMTNPSPPTAPADSADDDDDGGNPACVMVFNASDPSGAGGLAADVTAIASV